MADRFLRHRSIYFPNAQKFFRTILQPHQVSLEYRQWRDRLIQQRFWLIIGIAIAWLCLQGIADAYEVFINPQRLIDNLSRRQLTHLLEPIQQRFIWHKIVALSLLGTLALSWKSRWVRKNSRLMLLFVPWSIAFVPEMIVSIYFKLPSYPSAIMFMAQAVMMPIHWRLHLISQFVPIAFYFGVYPLIGMAEFAQQPIYSFSSTVQLILVCLICEVGVYLYEQSKQAELEATQRLQLCIHSITHDLRTPVMGSLMLLQSIRDSTCASEPIQLSQTEMEKLIQGNDRLLNLMNSLLKTELVLNYQPTDLSAIVATVLQDFESEFIKQNIQVNHQISANLPLVEVDAQQIARVFSNLIDNAVIHNPPGLWLTLKAIPSSKRLKVIVQDNGVGISPEQQAILFEPYTRGRQTQYRPGLGLGLYICRQVIEAHGGTIDVESVKGTTFYFTLPIRRSS